MMVASLLLGGNRRAVLGWSGLLLVASLAFFSAASDRLLPKAPAEKNDIYFIWEDGRKIANGENPYARIRGSDLRVNEKFAIYFPGFILAVAATIKLGLTTFSGFIAIWRPAGLLVHCLTGTLMFAALFARGRPVEGLLASQFYLFNRWNLSVLASGQIDLLAICFLVAALLARERHPVGSPLLFGCSLAIKQVAVFVLPLYVLTRTTRPSAQSGSRSWLKSSVLALAVPGLLSLPFLIAEPVLFVRSILFSATRNPGGHTRVQSFDHLMGWVGIDAKLPMLVLMALITYLVWRKRLGFLAGTVLVLAVFESFNSVLLWQYFCWPASVLPLLLLEVPPQAERRE